MILLAKLDRPRYRFDLTKQAGLSNQCPAAAQHSSRVRAPGFRSRDLNPVASVRTKHSAECVDIDNESNQVP